MYCKVQHCVTMIKHFHPSRLIDKLNNWFSFISCSLTVLRICEGIVYAGACGHLNWFTMLALQFRLQFTHSRLLLWVTSDSVYSAVCHSAQVYSQNASKINITIFFYIFVSLKLNLMLDLVCWPWFHEFWIQTWPRVLCNFQDLLTSTLTLDLKFLPEVCNAAK